MSFAVLQLSGCAGCEVSLLNANEWINKYKLVYMPLVISTHDMPEVEILLVTGGVRTDADLYNLRRSVGKASQVLAVGTCAISGGVASLGNRDDVRDLFLTQAERRHVPRLLPKCRPIDSVVTINRYLPGCPPTPELFMAALFGSPEYRIKHIVCKECGRKKRKDVRPTSLTGFQRGHLDERLCLINQGYLCVGSSTRGGCTAPCPRAGHPCVGCRGPSDVFIEKDSTMWFASILRVFESMTDIPSDDMKRALKSPQLSLFLFQFSDYSSEVKSARPKEKIL
jgi:F420-non-reducing hydrogenase small subunit